MFERILGIYRTKSVLRSVEEEIRLYSLNRLNEQDPDLMHDLLKAKNTLRDKYNNIKFSWMRKL